MFNLPYPVVLASSSEARRQLLTQLQFAFKCCVPDIDESPIEGESPLDLVVRLAKSKANALVDAHPGHIIIASDQVCLINGVIMGKPHTKEQAFKQLSLASNQAVPFLTSIALYDPETGNIETKVDTFTVHFRALTDTEIIRYIELDDPLQCAGSFKYESLGITLFNRLEGNDPTSLIGLGLISLSEMLRRTFPYR